MEHFILEDGSHFTGDPKYRPEGKEDMKATIVSQHPPYPANWDFDLNKWVVDEKEFLDEMEVRRTIKINSSIRKIYTLEQELKILRESLISGTITAEVIDMNDNIVTIITDNPETTKEDISTKIEELTGDSIAIIGDSI